MVSTLFTLVTGPLNVKDMASQKKIKSTADVVSEDSDSVNLSCESEYSRSELSTESSAGDVVNESLSPRKWKV